MALAEILQGAIGRPVNLRKSINDFLDKPMDPMGLYSRHGMEAPYSYGETIKQGLGVAPGLGDALSLADAYQAATDGNWGEAALSGLGVVPFVGSLKGVRRGFDSTSRLGEIGGKRAPEAITELEPGVDIGQRVSTANPTDLAAAKTGFHASPEFTIQGDMMRENPEAFAHNMQLMADHAIPTRKRSPDARYEDAQDWIQGNLHHWLDQAPDDFVKRSGNWYKGANALANDMARSYDIPVEAAAGVLARLSPGMDWFANVEQGDRLVDIWRNHQGTMMPEKHWNGGTNPTLINRPELYGTRLQDMKTDADRASWIRAFNDQTTPNNFFGLNPEGGLADMIMTKDGRPNSLMWQTNGNLAQAIAILNDPSMENISKNLGLSGHKIRNFYNNIVNPFHPDDTTIDTHAVSGSLMVPYSQKGVPVGHAFGGGAVKAEDSPTGLAIPGSAKSGMASGTYGLYADAHRQVAKDRGLLSMAVQSPVWEMVRETFPQNGKQKAKLQGEIESRVLNALRKGDISRDQAREQIIDLATGGKGIALPSWYRK